MAREIIRIGERAIAGKQGWTGVLKGEAYANVNKGTYNLGPDERRVSRLNGSWIANPNASRVITQDYTQPANYPNQDKTIEPNSPWNTPMENLRQALYKNKLNKELYHDQDELRKIYNIRRRNEYGSSEIEEAPKRSRSQAQKERRAREKEEREREKKEQPKRSRSQAQKERKAREKEEREKKEQAKRHRIQSQRERRKREKEERDRIKREKEVRDRIEREIEEREKAESDRIEREIEERDRIKREIEEIEEREKPQETEKEKRNVYSDETLDIIKKLDEELPSIESLESEAEMAGQKIENLVTPPSENKPVKEEEEELLDIIKWMIATCNININMRNLISLGSDREFYGAAHGKKKGEAKKDAGLIGGRGTGTVGNVPSGFMIPVEAVDLSKQEFRNMATQLSTILVKIKNHLISDMAIQQIYAILYRIYLWMKSTARGSRFLDSENWTNIYLAYSGIAPQVLSLANLSNSGGGVYQQQPIITKTP